MNYASIPFIHSAGPLMMDPPPHKDHHPFTVFWCQKSRGVWPNYLAPQNLQGFGPKIFRNSPKNFFREFGPLEKKKPGVRACMRTKCLVQNFWENFYIPMYLPTKYHYWGESISENSTTKGSSKNLKNQMRRAPYRKSILACEKNQPKFHQKFAKNT